MFDVYRLGYWRANITRFCFISMYTTLQFSQLSQSCRHLVYRGAATRSSQGVSSKGRMGSSWLWESRGDAAQGVIYKDRERTHFRHQEAVAQFPTGTGKHDRFAILEFIQVIFFDLCQWPRMWYSHKAKLQSLYRARVLTTRSSSAAVSIREAQRLMSWNGWRAWQITLRDDVPTILKSIKSHLRC